MTMSVTFPSRIDDIIYTLRRVYNNTRNTVVIAYPEVEITKFHSNRDFSFKLIFEPETETFEMLPPAYVFHSKISYFDFRKEEEHWSRNIKVIESLIKNLKFSGMWEIVSNKDLLVINKFNDRVDKKLRRKRLKSIIGD